MISDIYTYNTFFVNFFDSYNLDTVDSAMHFHHCDVYENEFPVSFGSILVSLDGNCSCLSIFSCCYP